MACCLTHTALPSSCMLTHHFMLSPAITCVISCSHRLSSTVTHPLCWSLEICSLSRYVQNVHAAPVPPQPAHHHPLLEDSPRFIILSALARLAQHSNHYQLSPPGSTLLGGIYIAGFLLDHKISLLSLSRSDFRTRLPAACSSKQ